ncbi:MAG: alpha amylase family protein [Prolixibacteraceae bacterium]
MNRIFNLFLTLLATTGLFSCSGDKQVKNEEVAPKLMWIDATANIERFNNKDTIDYYLGKLKELGFTDIVVDIRPISGHVLYESQYAPLLTEWDGKKISYTFDYLGYYIEKAHNLGLKVQASLNTFVAGHNFINSGLVYEGGKAGWASVVYPPAEEVKLIPITEEKSKYSAMVNPVNEEFQTYILNIFNEVVEKYPTLDGIILDRVRYDGFTADFSELSRKKFEEYLGKELDQFPDDIYRWKKNEEGKFYPERGKHFLQWIEWRASVIYTFMSRAREVVKKANPEISFGTYTGAWYPSYFEVGVNFASRNYDPSAHFDWASEGYRNYGYAELLDLYTVGNYYTTITIEEYLENNPEVKNETDMWAQQGTWYCVEGSNQQLKSILGGNKFYGGILADQFYTDPEGLARSIKMNLETSDGLMIFDIVHIIEKNMWKDVEKGMRQGGAIR